MATIRRDHGQPSWTELFKTRAKIDGQWTMYGLAQELGVQRNWRYAGIRRGVVPATRHPATGHYRIPDDPAMLELLRGQRERCGYREKGIVIGHSTKVCQK